MAPLRLALLGAGWIAERAYLPALAAVDELRLATLFDPLPARAALLAERLPPARAVATLAEALTGVDAALVCAPAPDHLPLLRACADAGLPVLCEKPVLRTLEEVRALEQSSPRLRLMGSATMRLRDDVATLLDWVAAGRVGRLRRLQLGWWRHQGVPSPGSWRTLAAVSPGGVLEDLGPHLLDLAAGLLRATGQSSPQPSELVHSLLQHRGGASDGGARWFGGDGNAWDAPDHAQAELVTPSGCEVSVEVAWTDPRPGDEVCISVEGDQGRARFEGLLGFSTARRRPEQRCVLDGSTGAIRRFAPGPELQQRAFAASLRQFAAFCRGDAPAISDVRDVAQVAAWMEQIREGTSGLGRAA